MPVTIDRNLNLVIPIYDGDVVKAHVFSTPIGRQVFEAYFRVIARTFAAIHGDDSDALGATAGPRFAALLLQDEARKMGIWDGPAGVQNGLVSEIRRLTNVLVPAERGWETLPFDDAVRTGGIDADDAAEVESAIVFFTVAWWAYPKNRRPVLSGAFRLWDGQCTSSSITEFRAGLPTSTAGESTASIEEAVNQTRLSIPS